MHIVPFIAIRNFAIDSYMHMRAGRNQFSQFSTDPAINIVHTESATTSSFEVNNALDTSKQP
jgi:hypothetical protein